MSPSTTNLIRDWLIRQQEDQSPDINELLQICEDRVRELVRRRLRDFPQVHREEQTTDIVNETLMQLVRQLGKTTFATPLHLIRSTARIIRHVLIDKSRAIRAKRRPRLEAFDSPEMESQPSTDHPIDLEIMSEFHLHIDSLPEEERILFDLLYYRGLTTSTAATLLNMPPTTLKNRWVKARVQLPEKFRCDFPEI
jgi:RNA polymerase sigma factor (sigma-70 family)